jgi:hypothetical protein
MIVECIAPDLIRSIWDRVEPMIDSAFVVADEIMPADMLARLETARMLLWAAIGEDGKIFAAMTTELVPMRSGLVCWMCQCGGSRVWEWSKFIDKIEEYARAEGCVRVVLRGRQGWRGVLDGYRLRSVQLEKVL